MNTKDSQSTPPPAPESIGCAAVCARLSWMVAGSFAISVTLMALAASPGPWIGVRDAVLAALVIATLVARYVDITRFGGTTTKGAPADVRTFLTYAAGLVVVVGALWAAIRVLAP